MALDDNRKIGTGLLVLGFVFLFLGVILFFDAGLLTIGDFLFLMGITMTIGVRRTFVFFSKRKQLRGNICFFGGILLVLFRWAFVGMILQVKISKYLQFTQLFTNSYSTTHCIYNISLLFFSGVNSPVDDSPS